MKKISVLIPCYNEEENVGPISDAVIDIITRELPMYDYELVFIDNDSTDSTRPASAGAVQKEPEDQGYFQCPEFRSVQFAVLWDPPGDRRLRDLHGGRLPGSGGADPPVCP